MGPLTANWKAASMTETSIAANVHQTFDIHLDALSEVALDLALRVDDGSDLIQFVFAKITDLCVEIDCRLVQDRRRARFPDPIDIGQAYLRSLIRW